MKLWSTCAEGTNYNNPKAYFLDKLDQRNLSWAIYLPDILVETRQSTVDLLLNVQLNIMAQRQRLSVVLNIDSFFLNLLTFFFILQKCSRYILTSKSSDFYYFY